MTSHGGHAQALYFAAEAVHPMKLTRIPLLLLIGMATLAARADIVVLRDGKSYTGTYTAPTGGKINFRDAQGIRYAFPLSDVQTIVFSTVADHVSLRNGQSYSGQMVGATTLSFQGSNGVSYTFPMRDLSSLIISAPQPAVAASAATPVADAAATMSSVPAQSPAPIQSQQTYPAQSQYPNPSQSQYQVPTPQQAYPTPSPNSSYPQNDPTLQQHSAQSYMASAGNGNAALVIPSGSQVVVRTDMPIDSSQDSQQQFYPAQIQQDIMDGNGQVAIPAGTSAKLQLLDTAANTQGNYSQNNYSQNSSSSSKILMLDLYSVTVRGKEYRVDTTSVTDNGTGAGVGVNKKTGEFAGGGGALGALLGAAFGGGKGAGIGALLGAGGGVLTQVLTSGKQVKIPAETTLTFQLTQTLVLHP